MKRTHTLLGRFAADERGNVLMMTGLAIMFLIGAGGAGIDLGRQQLLRLKLQQAADAGALAAASMPVGSTSAQKEATATRYFNLNFGQSYLGVANPGASVNVSGDTISVSANATMNTNFVSSIGTGSVGSRGASTVKAEQAVSEQSYEVYLVMDNSGSMACGANVDQSVCTGSPTRLASLKTSSMVIVDDLLKNNSVKNRVGAVTWGGNLSQQSNSPAIGWEELTETHGTIRTFINNMTAIATSLTYSASGMSKARSMSQHSTKGFQKNKVHAVILLTDGVNGYGSATMAERQAANNATLPICTAFKNDDVLVYTIAFGKDVAPGSPFYTLVNNFLSACASGTAGANQGKYFFSAPDDATLKAVFGEILTSLGKIRITE